MAAPTNGAATAQPRAHQRLRRCARVRLCSARTRGGPPCASRVYLQLRRGCGTHRRHAPCTTAVRASLRLSSARPLTPWMRVSPRIGRHGWLWCSMGSTRFEPQTNWLKNGSSNTSEQRRCKMAGGLGCAYCVRHTSRVPFRTLLTENARSYKGVHNGAWGSDTQSATLSC